MAKNSWILDGAALVLAAGLLIAPLFLLEYSTRWWSIESTFLAEARLLAAGGGDWRPLWYCGTPAAYLYPPLIPHSTAWLAGLARVSPARAYHALTGLFYALGIAAVYALARTGAGSRPAAFAAAAATALLSPSFLFLPELRIDSGWGAPQRLHVLMVYGEGPHISSLSLVPLALALSWRAFASARW
ncbi:MAG: hypothetical protein ACRD96_25010, partial [Bryobacteraceae bacterium]